MEKKYEKIMLTVDDVAEILGIKRSRAYTVIREMNSELAAKGKLTIRGRINKKFFESKITI